jgi:hypothetical protein
VIPFDGGVDLDEVLLTANVNGARLEAIRGDALTTEDLRFLVEEARAAQELRRAVATLLFAVALPAHPATYPAMTKAWRAANETLKKLGHRA